MQVTTILIFIPTTTNPLIFEHPQFANGLLQAPATCGHPCQEWPFKVPNMKRLSLFIASTALIVGLGLAAPLFAQTTHKVTITAVDPAVLTTAWRATDIIGATIYDDNGAVIGKVHDLLVAQNGTVPFVIVTNIPENKDTVRDVVVSAADFELVGKKLTLHGGSAGALLGLPIF